MIQLTGPSLSATTGVAIQGGTIQPNGSFQPGSALALQASGNSVQCSVPPLTAALLWIGPPATPPLTIVSSAYNSSVGAPASLVTAYGSGLSSSVSILDSAGVAYSVTPGYSSSAQVNFLIPAGIAIGAAIVTINGQTAALQIANVAPGLFTLNSSGLAAAYAIRVAPGGAQSTVPVFSAQNGAYSAAPINVATSAGQVFLILFGTGIRGAIGGVNVTIQGIAATVAYAGAQGTDAGLDQVNVLLPAQLAGSGTVNIVLTTGLNTSNTVTVDIQ